jgi:predicted nucleic acid-binding protein
MNGSDFLDTNVLVYALDVADPAKHKIARPLLTRAVAGEFAISTQVLAELATTLLKRYQARFAVREVLTLLDSLKPVPLIKPDGDMVRRAVEAHAAYGLHFYDGMIIAAAERAGSETIWSEDLNAGQKYFGVTVVNPFG